MTDKNEDDKKFLPTSETCFVCGEKNPAGIHARFFVEEGLVKTCVTVKPDHCGYANVVHGGIAAALLDECMSWAAAHALNRLCVTAKLNVRYLKPIPGNQPIVVTTEVIRANKRLAVTRGSIMAESGEVYVRGEAQFLPLSRQETLEVDDNLIYRGDEVRLFDALKTE